MRKLTLPNSNLARRVGGLDFTTKITHIHLAELHSDSFAFQSTTLEPIVFFVVVVFEDVMKAKANLQLPS